MRKLKLSFKVLIPSQSKLAVLNLLDLLLVMMTKEQEEVEEEVEEIKPLKKKVVVELTRKPLSRTPTKTSHLLMYDFDYNYNLISFTRLPIYASN